MQLIIFFNGWGMSEKVVREIENQERFEIIHLNFPYMLKKVDFSKYSKIYVIAWSFGVYYASKFLLKNQNLNTTSIAINGTPYPIGEYGIPLKLFNMTLDSLSVESLKKFYKNMGAPENLFDSGVDIKKLSEELRYILNNPTTKYYNFDRVFLGKEDRIIPYSRQLKYYKERETEIITLDCEHYPFKLLNDWRRVIE